MRCLTAGPNRTGEREGRFTRTASDDPGNIVTASLGRHPTCDQATCAIADAVRLFMDSWWRGLLESSLEAAERAFRDPDASCGDQCTAYAGLRLALLLSYIRHSDAARDVLDSLHRIDDPWLSITATLVRSTVALAEGDHAAAADGAWSALHRAEEAGQPTWTPLGNFALGLASLRQGQMPQAIHYAQRLRNDAVFNREMFPGAQAAWLITQIAETEKGPDEAAQLSAELLRSREITRRLLICEPAAVPWLMRLMLSRGDRSLAENAVRTAQELSQRNPGVRSVRAAWLHCAGLLGGDIDRLDIDRLRSAVDTHADAWSRASAAEDVGALLAERDPDHSEAAEYLELAMLRYAELGALRDCSRAKSRLRQIKVVLDTRDVGRRRSAVPVLTDTEYAVAKIVAEGFTNGQVAEQLYLSRHTVAFHLRKIFRKLGVDSRVQLARIWPNLDLITHT